MNVFFCSKKCIIDLSKKKLLIIIAFHLLINPFFISQNNPDCFLFEVSQLKLKNSNKGPIKNIPEELKYFRPFKKQLNELLKIRRNQFYYVDSILKENKLPESFGFLPLVLSGYNSCHTTDLSSKGIWALSYITALKKGLQINSHIDQRMNNRLATYAAVKQLKFLMEKYKSENWTLLAFITSPSYVSNIFKESKSKKWNLAQKFIDTKYLKNIELINWLNQLDIKTFNGNYKTTNKNYQNFSFKEDLLFDAIAQFKIIDFKQISIKNPFLTGQMIPKNQSIVLQKELGNFIIKSQSKIVAFQDSMTNNLFLKEKPGNKHLIYTIKYGDVLGQIAIDYNVSVTQIMKWNNLSSTMIYQGQELKLFSNKMAPNFKVHFYTINKEKYFWEVALNNPETSIKNICKYNIYQELKQNQKLKITNK
jgi:membrane-bound lytic murein transglycosylase D